MTVKCVYILTIPTRIAITYHLDFLSEVNLRSGLIERM